MEGWEDEEVVLIEGGSRSSLVVGWQHKIYIIIHVI
jgi:hypothetical protein